MHIRIAGMNGKFKALAVAFAMTAAASGMANAQALNPSKPIRIIVPYAAGGGGDTVIRNLADGITKQFGFTVLVENRTGAGSNIGSLVVAKAEPDGHTLLLGSNGNAVNSFLYASMPYDPGKELTPIIFMGRSPTVLIASPTTSFKSVSDIVEQAKAKTIAINFGSGGIGTSEHLTYELFKRRTGIDAVHVPYRGGAAVVPDLINGRVHLAFTNLFGAMPLIKSGQLRAIGLANPTRSPLVPDLPTMDEQGLKNFNASGWFLLMGPGNMNPALVLQINKMVNTVLESPDFAKRFAAMGAERIGGTPQQAQDYFRGEMATWSEVIKAQNIKAE